MKNNIIDKRKDVIEEICHNLIGTHLNNNIPYIVNLKNEKECSINKHRIPYLIYVWSLSDEDITVSINTEIVSQELKKYIDQEHQDFNVVLEELSIILHKLGSKFVLSVVEKTGEHPRYVFKNIEIDKKKEDHKSNFPKNKIDWRSWKTWYLIYGTILFLSYMIMYN